MATAASQLPAPSAHRINRALTAVPEKRALQWLARHAPRWLTSDQLTVAGLIAQVAAGFCYALARSHRSALLLASICIVFNWLGDSLDGTLARERDQQRPRYGFYVDHIVDVLGSIALMCGLACSAYLQWQSAIAMLLAFLVLASESYLATCTLSRFQLSQGVFGPTEVRLLLIAGNLALLHNPYATVFGYKLLLFDLGGVIAAACMLGTAVVTIARHTAELGRLEPLP